MGKEYRAIYIGANKTAYEHILIAEKAFGGPLPAGVEVHHVNENKKDNSNENLVICQDRAYHGLLHRRTRILKAGFDPNTHKICQACKQGLPLTEFSFNRCRVDGYRNECKRCHVKSVKEYVLRTKRSTTPKRYRKYPAATVSESARESHLWQDEAVVTDAATTLPPGALHA